MTERRIIGGLGDEGFLSSHFSISPSPIFVPLAFFLFVISLVWAVQAALQQRLSKLLALLITLAIAALVLNGTGSLTAWAFSKLAHWFFVMPYVSGRSMPRGSLARKARHRDCRPIDRALRATLFIGFL